MADPIRIYIGSARRFAACEPVIARSIRAHTAQPVEIQFIRPETLDVPPTGCTGFTNLRYAVPELAGYAGFAIYLDVDMLVLGDIAELYAYREAGHWVQLQDGSSEVAVISCGTHRHLPSLGELHRYHKSQLQGLVRAKNRIPLTWNSEDRVTEGMRLLHFTDLKTQPWFTHTAPHPCPAAVDLWRRFA